MLRFSGSTPLHSSAFPLKIDAVGSFFHGGGTFFHGWVFSSHGIPFRTGGVPPERDAMKKNAHYVKFFLHRFHFRGGQGREKGDAT